MKLRNFGKGAINEIVTEVKARGCQHVVVITDKDLMKFKVSYKDYRSFRYGRHRVYGL